MIFSGYNSRKIGGGKNFTFAINFLVEDTNWYPLYEFGFSGLGSGENITWTLSEGTMLDPEGKHFGNYEVNERTLISGNVSPSTYDYYVGNKQNYTKGSRSDFTIDSFFVNSKPMSIDGFDYSWAEEGLDADIYISSLDKPRVSSILSGAASFNNYKESGTMTGLMTNHDFSGIGAFTIFSGEVVQTDDIKYFEFDTGVYSFPRRVESSDNFAVKLDAKPTINKVS